MARKGLHKRGEYSFQSLFYFDSRYYLHLTCTSHLGWGWRGSSRNQRRRCWSPNRGKYIGRLNSWFCCFTVNKIVLCSWLRIESLMVTEKEKNQDSFGEVLGVGAYKWNTTSLGKTYFYYLLLIQSWFCMCTFENVNVWTLWYLFVLLTASEP